MLWDMIRELQALSLPKQHDTDVSVLASELNSQ